MHPRAALPACLALSLLGCADAGGPVATSSRLGEEPSREAGYAVDAASADETIAPTDASTEPPRDTTAPTDASTEPPRDATYAMDAETPRDATPTEDIATAPDVTAADVSGADVSAPDASGAGDMGGVIPDGTILFVTQVPNGAYVSVARTFSNHVGSIASAPRGGALMLRYPDGTLRNLTREAGYGVDGMQGATSVAAREPTVYWDGRRALFSMVVGAPRRYEVRSFFWQIYEVSGLAPGERALIRRVPGQSAVHNNVSPVYGSDDAVIFVSDRPRGGETHLYPQLDEYESAPSTSGLWRTDAAGASLTLLEHAPSGAFTPTVDSFGRVIFTKWDHLQRDQQADATRFDGASYFAAMTWADESPTAARSATLAGSEVYPEPRDSRDPDRARNVSTHAFNHFFPWQLMQDGTTEETLNHVGRHEFGGTYTNASFTDDPNLSYHTPDAYHLNRFYLYGNGGLLQMREDPRAPGVFLATYAQEFSTDGAGMLLRVEGAPSLNPESMRLLPVTHPDTYTTTATATNSGHYRNPLPMSDGTLIAAHTAITGVEANLGTTAAPRWTYDFRLKTLRSVGGTYVPDTALTAGINASVQWYDPDTLVSWTGALWELDPTEVHPRTRPPMTAGDVPAVERQVFTDEGVDLEAMRTWLRANDLALLVTRDVTQRDRADVQQPFNLHVPGGTQSVGHAGRVYDVPFLQVFQADAVRGYGGVTAPRAGRRFLARPMHAAVLPNPAVAGAPVGGVAVSPDGSFAAFVPARRALTWQLTDGAGAGVVRERNWVSFQPGEIRACPSCHGVNTRSQTMLGGPSNAPQALRSLLQAWRAATP